MTVPTLREASRKVAAAARRHLGSHPQPRALIAYQAGELPKEEEGRLQDHLVLCPDCAKVVLDLAAFPEVNIPQEKVRALEALVPSWESIHERLLEQREGRVVAARDGSRRWRERLLLAVAASFFLLMVGLAYRVVTLESQLAGDRVRGDLPLFTLTAEGAIRSHGEESLSVAAERFNLLLFVADPGSYESYQLEAVSGVGPDRVAVWSLPDLRPTSEGVFLVVGLSRQELPPRSYTFELYGRRAGRRILLANYPVLIEYH